MLSPIARLGDSFEGVCRACEGDRVTGKLTSNGGFLTIEGRNFAVTGTVGTGECGHTCAVVGLSEIMAIEGRTVARLGDPVTGVIEGTITTGCSFMATE